jgi:DNA-binding MarR family transcriptional regulator
MDTEWADDERAGEPRVILEPIRPARSYLNYWVRQTHQRFAKNFGQLLKEAGIIASEWAALRELYRPQRWSPVALGQAIGMSKGGASKLVSRLVAKGLAVKDSNESDRRFRAVGLTQLGRELIVFLAQIETDTDREFFAPLGNGRRFRLMQYMNRVLDSGRSSHLQQWVLDQLKKSDLKRFTLKAKAIPADGGRAKADELWEYFQRVTEANALEKPAPAMPEWLEAQLANAGAVPG